MAIINRKILGNKISGKNAATVQATNELVVSMGNVDPVSVAKVAKTVTKLLTKLDAQITTTALHGITDAFNSIDNISSPDKIAGYKKGISQLTKIFSTVKILSMVGGPRIASLAESMDNISDFQKISLYKKGLSKMHDLVGDIKFLEKYAGRPIKYLSDSIEGLSNKGRIRKFRWGIRSLVKIVDRISLLEKINGENLRSFAEAINIFTNFRNILMFKWGVKSITKITNDLLILQKVSGENLKNLSVSMSSFSDPMKLLKFSMGVKLIKKLIINDLQEINSQGGYDNLAKLGESIALMSDPKKLITFGVAIKVIKKYILSDIKQINEGGLAGLKNLSDSIVTLSDPMRILRFKLSMILLKKTMKNLPVMLNFEKIEQTAPPEPPKKFAMGGILSSIGKGIKETTKNVAKKVVNVVRKPTEIQTPSGSPGVVGEAGPEAIIPLKKMPEVAAGMSEGLGTNSINANQQEMLYNQSQMESELNRNSVKNSEISRELSDVKRRVYSIPIPGSSNAGPSTVKKEDEPLTLAGLISGVGLLGTALFTGIGAWLAKEHPGIGYAIKHVVGVGRTIAKFAKPIIEFFPKLLDWGKTLSGSVLKGMQKIPFLGKLFTKGGANVALKVGKAAGKGVFKKMMGTIFKMVVKKLPFVGLGMGLYNAWEKWPADKEGSVIEIASGLASLLPGVGTAVSAALDLYMLTRGTPDPETNGSAKKPDSKKEKGSVLSILSGLFGSASSSVDSVVHGAIKMATGSPSEQASQIKAEEKSNLAADIASMIPPPQVIQTGGGGGGKAMPLPARILQSGDSGFMNNVYNIKFNMG